MDKTHNISLGGFSFLIEDKAYQQLSIYLNDVRKSLGESADTEEIIYDVEQRMAELLKGKMSGREVIINQDITYLIDVLGKPEQYVDDEKIVSEDTYKAGREPFSFGHKKLFRDLENKQVAGVFSGLSHYLAIEKTLLRIFFILLGMAFSFIVGRLFAFDRENYFMYMLFWAFIYSVLALIIPPAKTTAEKLAMLGKQVNLDTLSTGKDIKIGGGLTLATKSGGRLFLGVFAGIANYYAWDVLWIRISYILLLVISIPFAGRLAFPSFLVIFYLILWLSINRPKNNFLQGGENQSEQATTNGKSQFLSFNIWLLFRSILKGIFYLLAGIVLFVLFWIVIALILSVFGISLISGFSIAALSDFLPFVIEEKGLLVAFYVFVGLSLLLFVSVLTIFGLRILIKNYKTPKVWVLANIITFFVSFFGLILVSGLVVRHFRLQTYLKQDFPIESTSDTIFIDKKSLDYDIYSGFPFSVDENDQIQMDFLKFYVQQKDISQPYVQVQSNASGKDMASAKKNAQKIEIPLKIDGNHIRFSNVFKLEKKAVYRKQRLYMRLYIPKGKYIKYTTDDERDNLRIIKSDEKSYRIPKDTFIYID